MNRKPLSVPILLAIGVVIFVLGAYAVRTWGLQNILEQDYAALDGGLYADVVQQGGQNYLVPPDQIYDSGLTSDNLPALNNPKFVSVSEADSYIADDLPGIAVEVGDDHRFYPIQVLAWHIVVNDTVGGKNLLVSYDPLTGNARVFDRGDQTFTISGKVYNNNTLLKTNNDDLWSQALGRVIIASDTGAFGATLEPYASDMLLWSTWKEVHANGVALSKETGFVRDYTHHPYGGYMTSQGIYFPLNHLDDRLSHKWIVYGIGNDRAAIAFAKDILYGKGALNEDFDGLPVVALYDYDQKVGRVFLRSSIDDVSNDEVTSQVLTFVYDFKTKRLTDSETGSIWNAQGLSTSGQLRGMQLGRVAAPESFFFSWASYYPQTSISGVEVVTPEAEAEPAL